MIEVDWAGEGTSLVQPGREFIVADFLKAISLGLAAVVVVNEEAAQRMHHLEAHTERLRLVLYTRWKAVNLFITVSVSLLLTQK